MAESTDFSYSVRLPPPPLWIFRNSDWATLYIYIHIYIYTVVPALGDPRRERPPALCGHVFDAPTHTFQR